MNIFQPSWNHGMDLLLYHVIYFKELAGLFSEVFRYGICLTGTSALQLLMGAILELH